MEILKISNNDTLYCFNDYEYDRLKSICSYISVMLYHHCYKRGRITKEESRTLITQFKEVLGL